MKIHKKTLTFTLASFLVLSNFQLPLAYAKNELSTNSNTSINLDDLKKLTNSKHSETTDWISNYDINNDGVLDIYYVPNETVKKESDIFVSIPQTSEFDDSYDSFNTPIIKVATTNYEATVTGKGEEALEEGYSTVLIHNVKTDKISEFKFNTKGISDQRTAKKVTCGSENLLYIIVGHAYGHTSQGGSLYSLNVETGVTKLVASPDEYEEIVDASLSGNTLKLKCYLYDDNYNNYTIGYKNITI